MNICKVTDCTNHQNCIRHCVDNAGYTLVEFLTNIDVVETQIGELHQNKIVTGIMIEPLSSPSHILSSLNSKIDNSNKFFTLFGKAPLQILIEYTTKYGLDKDNILKNRLKGIINNKVLVTPIKPKTSCKIVSETEKNKSSDITVEFLKLFTDENGKFQYIIISEMQEINGEQKRQRISLSEYGKSLRLNYIENGLKVSNIDRGCIVMTDSGFIRPIAFKDNNITIAIDGSYVYQVKQTYVEIIGVWGRADSIIESDKMQALDKSKAYKELMNNINYISKHKRFIVPYGFIKINDIIVER